jgi:hypothetical protein
MVEAVRKSRTEARTGLRSASRADADPLAAG